MINFQASQHKQRDIEDLAERAERGEDISAHFTTTYTAKQRR